MKVPRKLNTADSLSDPVPDFFSTPAANSSHTDEGRSAKHLLCSALFSSGISCAAFPVSAAPGPSCARTHTHTKTHTYTFIAGSSSVVCTNKHINSFVFPLCLSVSRRLKPVWFYLYCFSLGPKLYLFYSKACTHLGPESAYSSIHWFTAMHMVLPQRDSAIL